MLKSEQKSYVLIFLLLSRGMKGGQSYIVKKSSVYLEEVTPVAATLTRSHSGTMPVC